MNLTIVEQLTQVVGVTAMTPKRVVTGMMEKRRFYHARLEMLHFVWDLWMVELTEKA